MGEQPKPATTPPYAAATGGGGRPKPDAFDLWLRGALGQLFGAIADEPVPAALRQLVAETAPAAEVGTVGPPSRRADVKRRTRRWAAARTTA